MSNKKNDKKNTVVMLGIIIGSCLALSLLGALIFKIIGPNNTYTNLSEYLGIKADNELALIINTEKTENAILVHDEIFVPLDVVSEKISSRFYYDSSADKLLIVTPEGTTEIDGSSDSIYKLGTRWYLCLKNVVDNYPCEIKADGTDNVVWVWSDYDGKYEYVIATENTRMRVSSGIRAEIACDIMEGDRLIYISSDDKFIYCMNENGIQGYVKKGSTTEAQSLDNAYTGDKKLSFDSMRTGNRIRMGWHMLDEFNYTTQNDSLSGIINTSNGLNVVSPTWYSVKDAGGRITDFSDKAYVDKAHAAGIQVWGLVDNFSQELDNKKLLSNADVRRQLIDKLLSSAISCGMDGINLDFEVSSAAGGFGKECGVHYLQFVREITQAFHAYGMAVSVDLPVPFSYNAFFNREELGRVADYIIVMGYDEHYSSSDTPGSVASPEFVRNGIAKTIEEVKPECVILGVPFYTRQWTVDAANNILGTRERGQRELELFLMEQGIKTTWDDTNQQNYAEYQNEYGTVKVWLDDAVSLSWKMKMVSEYGIAGAAAWRLGIETNEMWEVFVTE